MDAHNIFPETDAVSRSAAARTDLRLWPRSRRPAPPREPACPLTRELWALAWPAILRNALNCASDRLTLAFVGHWDQDEAHYDGAGIGKMYSNITGLSVGLGITLGLSTLCSQAFGAGRAAAENGVHLRRCLLLLGVAFVYSAAAAAFARPVLLLLRQPAAVAATSAAYAQVQLVGVPLFWAAVALQTVCDGCQTTRPGMYANLIASAAQVRPRGSHLP